MERMTGIDAIFLYAESQEQPMVVNGVITLDVSGMSGGYSFEWLRVELARRIKEIPQFRRRLYDSVLNLGHPAWVEDYDLDIRDHFKRLVMPTPHPPRAIEETCGVLASRPLDRSRPLWEAFAIENPEEPDTVTILARAHHSVVDGMTASRLIRMLGGSDQIHPERDPDLMRIEAGGKNAVQLIAGGALDYLSRPLRVARLLPETLMLPLTMRSRKPGGGEIGTGDAQALPAGAGHHEPESPEEAELAEEPDTAEEAVAAAESVAAEDAETPPEPGASGGMPAPFTAPRTPFNATLTPHRALATTEITLDDALRIKTEYGIKLNDVLLAVVGGALRRYLIHHDGLPEKSLSAVVPTSVHSESESKSSNKLSLMFGTLGTDIADPVERLLAIGSRATRVKSQSSSMRPDFLQDWASMSPARTLGVGFSLYRQFRLADLHPVVYNLIVSNVPGPSKPVYFLGARVRNMYPMGPLLHGMGLNITAFSLGEYLNIGVIACEHLIPDPDRLTRAIRAEFDELLDAVDGGAQNITELHPA